MCKVGGPTSTEAAVATELKSDRLGLGAKTGLLYRKRLPRPAATWLYASLVRGKGLVRDVDHSGYVV